MMCSSCSCSCVRERERGGGGWLSCCGGRLPDLFGGSDDYDDDCFAYEMKSPFWIKGKLSNKCNQFKFNFIVVRIEQVEPSFKFIRL